MKQFLFVDQRSTDVFLIWIIFPLITIISLTHGFDPLDPLANITIKWDLLQATSGTSNVKVSVFNYQLYRHIEAPGWKLSWIWKDKQVIWGIWGAEATEQGDCSEFTGDQLPHCCEKQPVIIDLLPGAPYNQQSQNCCKGGVLSSLVQDRSKSGATFQMSVGAASGANSSHFDMPGNFTIGVPGYTCEDAAVNVTPTRFPVDGGRRWTQALQTWTVTCVYSQITVAPRPRCCVSLSAFYNSTIVSCPKCSCNCRGLPGADCVKFGDTPPLLQQKHDPNEEPKPIVRCTDHLCPIRVHWHVKQSYTEYWRVKMTVTNLNLIKNYSLWNLEVQHPNLKSLTQVFSFNYAPLNQYGYVNDSGMFWGIQYYNDMLLQAGDSGNVQTEMLLHKDPGVFTLNEGWIFPRRISFNGDECVMPSPDEFPRLPNGGQSTAIFSPFMACSSLLLLLLVVF